MRKLLLPISILVCMMWSCSSSKMDKNETGMSGSTNNQKEEGFKDTNKESSYPTSGLDSIQIDSPRAIIHGAPNQHEIDSIKNTKLKGKVN